jgi:prepilin-type N-terminal cleavage/methylation domain-containing protein
MGGGVVAFTLIELLTVIAIIAVLAALAGPVFKQFSKSDVNVSATRQMLDDCARARQLAIANRSTVFMVFVSTNFWNDPFKLTGVNEWTTFVHTFAPLIEDSMTVTQMYAAQWNGYYIESVRTIGDQPGQSNPQDLQKVKTLPAGSFIAPFKFTAPKYPSASAPYPTNRSDLPIYGFLLTNNIPFPTSDLLTNPAFALQSGVNPNFHYVTVPYIAFNYLGQLTPGDGTLLTYDENIPLDYGSIAEPISTTNRAPVQGFPTVIESPPGNSTNMSYNVIHIDRLTGRARLEQQAAQ